MGYRTRIRALPRTLSVVLKGIKECHRVKNSDMHENKLAGPVRQIGHIPKIPPLNTLPLPS
jgi:hypothetical protein